jgi:hypothetical protein
MIIAKEMVGEMGESAENLPQCRKPHAVDWNADRMGAVVLSPCDACSSFRREYFRP